MEKIKGFVIYPTYRIIDNKAFVYLFGRLENGESFLTINYTKPYFFIRSKDTKKIIDNADIKYETESTNMKNFYEEEVIKIIGEVPSDIPRIRNYFQKFDVPTYEADIRFVYRYMIDKGIRGSLEIKGEYKKGNYVNRIYEEPELSQCEYIPDLRVVSIDIETSMDIKNIYCISLFSNDFSKSLIVSDKKVSNAEVFKTEAEMLNRFKEIIINYDPDIITGWNLIGFDLKVLRDKFQEHKIDFVLGRADWPCVVKIHDSFLKDPTADFPGRMVLDAMQLMRTSFIRLTDYKLQTAAEEILGDSKIKLSLDIDKGREIENQYNNHPEKLVDYCLKDAELVIKILEKKKVIGLSVQRSLLTGMQLDRIKASIASLDNLYIREAMKRGYVCKTSSSNDRSFRIKGGFVRDSIPGIYDFIDVLDFKSLYPSIMRTFNIDPISFIPKELHSKYNEHDVIAAPNGAWFRKESGVLPLILQELWHRRDVAKKAKNAEQSYAIKITMNSFFGVLANPVCRFYSLDMANAITHFGQFIVKKSAEIVEDKGHVVIYGDTDSIFIETNANGMEDAKITGEVVQKIVNDYWDEYTANLKIKSYLELQFEKTYIRFMMPKIRGTEIGAKKRYAGLLLKDDKEVIDFTGLEFVRRDWTKIAKKFQLELLDRIFHKKEVVGYIKSFVDELKKGTYDELLVYRKSIRKDLDKYVKTTPPHVKAARKLDKVTSSIIAYVMTTDGPEPLQKVEHKLDYEHYIEKQIKPIADSVLGFFDTNFDDLLLDSKQTNLFGY
ncbi:MAG: DNA polymerase II [archaeon]